MVTDTGFDACLARAVIGGNPSSGSFPKGTKDGLNINFTGGSVKDGASVTFSWGSLHASAAIADGFWTSGGTNIGTIDGPLVNLIFQNVNGSLIATFVNGTGGAVSYTDLQLFTGANAVLFTNRLYVTGETTGSPVPLLVPTSGTFALGKTTIAMFAPSHTGYSADSVNINGIGLFASGINTVPEPGTLLLFGTGLVTIAGRLRRKLRM